MGQLLCVGLCMLCVLLMQSRIQLCGTRLLQLRGSSNEKVPSCGGFEDI